MSTQDKANNELDDAFRKSLEEPDIPFDPLAWQAMEKKLDKYHSDKVAYWRFFGLLALLLVFTSLGVWYQTSQGNKRRINGIEQPFQANNPSNGNSRGQENSNALDVQKHTQPKASVAEKATERKNLANPAPVPNTVAEGKTEPVKQENLRKKESSNNFEKESKPVVEKGVVKEPSDQLALEKNPKGALLKAEAVPRKKESKRQVFEKPSEQSTGLVEVNQKKKPGTELTKSSQKRKSALTFEQKSSILLATKAPGRKTNTNIKPYQEINTNEVTSIDSKGKSISSVSNSAKFNGSKTDTKTNSPDSPFLILGAASIRSVQLVPTQVSIAEVPLAAQTPTLPEAQSTEPVPTLAKRRKQPLEHSISLNLMLAPDFSTVGFSNFTKPGSNLGLAIEYGFSKRVSILVGALYSTKIYNADGEDYKPPSGYWPPYGAPDEIKGDCKVIDLPINLRYNALLGERYKVYVSAGMSSYLMQKEQYIYLYTGYPARPPWTAPTRNQHWFSVANFSVGYEVRLKGPVSFQIEPFVKIPLAGVGAGKVKLATTGAFFTLKYHLGK